MDIQLRLTLKVKEILDIRKRLLLMTKQLVIFLIMKIL